MGTFVYCPRASKEECDENIPLIEKWFDENPDRDDCQTDLGWALVRRGHVKEDLYLKNGIKEPQMTGCISTDIRENAPCPKCGVKAGETCRTPSGRKSRAMGGGHSERASQFYLLFPDYMPKTVDNQKIEDIL